MRIIVQRGDLNSNLVHPIDSPNFVIAIPLQDATSKQFAEQTVLFEQQLKKDVDSVLGRYLAPERFNVSLLVQWNQKLLEEIQGFERDIADLKARLKDTDKHIQWDQLDEQDRFKKPSVGRKRLMDSIRMIAYRAETAMSALITGPTIDTAAARRLLQDLFSTEADIFPDHENRRLLVSVHRGSRPAADQALAKLFEHLNAAAIIYPGTDLRLVYDFVGSHKSKKGVTSTSKR